VASQGEYYGMTPSIKFGLIGAGRIARNQIAPAIHATRHATLYATASRDLDRAKSTKPYRAYDSYDALINDPEIAAVYVATHNGLHKELSIAAMRAGKHVICEKPLAMNARDCEEMLRVSESTGVLLAEAFMYRHHPQIARTQELVRSGAIGDLMTVEASFRFPLSNVDDVRMVAEWGGGSLLDVGCYCVSASRLFLGDSPVAMKAMATFHPVQKVDISTIAILDYGSGRYAILSCGFDSGINQKIVLSGSMGVIELNHPFKSWTGSPQIIVKTKDGDQSIDFAPVNTFVLEVDDLAQCIVNGATPLVGPGDAIRNLKILDDLAAAAR
ncbi:MAG TPA: Gfo/Idh/MocA family oxidoreductase, partial [Gemmatimonadaceae bacterium]|nr:Gfo/Idh/MocA family oxidoreductase [Gemmatimonadaceae bacterium]